MIYAACVFSRSEKDVTADLAERGFSAYYPRETVDRILMGRKRRSTRPAYPGYVFVQCEPEELCQVSALHEVYAFVTGVRPDGSRAPAPINPADLRDIFLAELFGELDLTRQPEAWTPGRGERVMVKTGIWKDYIGKIIRMSKRECWIEPERKGGVLRVKIEELRAA
jgi:transcription antitermination factor NusG